MAWTAGAGHYTVWSADSNGNWIQDLIHDVPGTNTALESIETTFKQDLNGDGVIGVPVSAATSPVATNQATANQLAGSGPINATAAAGDTFVFAPNFGHVTITNVMPPAGLEFSNAVFANTNALMAAAQDDSHGNVIITDAAHDTLTIQNMTLAQLHTHQSDFHIV